MPKGTIQNLRVEDSVSWTASTLQSYHRSSRLPHTSSEFWKQELQCLSTFQLARQVFDLEEDNCSRRARMRNRYSCLKYKVKRSCRSKVRGCALNSVEHPHGEGNHEHVSQLMKSSCQAPPSQMKRNAKLLPSSQRAARPRMWRWPRV